MADDNPDVIPMDKDVRCSWKSSHGTPLLWQRR
jgi:hypothetical protein